MAPHEADTEDLEAEWSGLVLPHRVHPHSNPPTAIVTCVDDVQVLAEEQLAKLQASEASGSSASGFAARLRRRRSGRR